MVQSSKINYVLLYVTVYPNSKKTKIKSFKIENEFIRLEIFIKSPPKDNLANKELLNYLSMLFNKKVSIKSGSKTPKKKIIVWNTSKEEIEKILNRLINIKE